MSTGRWRFWMAIVLLAILATACDQGGLRAVERQQIQNLVRDYWVRNTNIPDYQVDIEKVDGAWVRVRLTPVGVEADKPTLAFLQKQAGQEELTPAATAAPQTVPGNTGPVTTTSGWTLVLGPKTDFDQAELAAAGVPESLWP